MSAMFVSLFIFVQIIFFALGIITNKDLEGQVRLYITVSLIGFILVEVYIFPIAWL